jgi:hypothetical protein
MVKLLDARDPAQVSSHRVLDADLGVGNRHLLVISGIAIYDWKIDTDETAIGEVRVLLATHARELEQASPFVGLASISNDESEFVFATDLARVDIDPATGELSLYVHTALMGESSQLGRFSYQVVATVVRIGSSISGKISWPTSLMKPNSNDPSLVAPHLSVVANKHETKSGSGIFASTETLTPLLPGAILSLNVGEIDSEATYRIDSPPMAMPLKVTVDVRAEFANQSGGPIVAGQVSGPQVFTLTPYHPNEVIDFRIGQIVVR